MALIRERRGESSNRKELAMTVVLTDGTTIDDVTGFGARIGGDVQGLQFVEFSGKTTWHYKMHRYYVPASSILYVELDD
jgi:hypothetical protein